jgi:hypothetical protein
LPGGALGADAPYGYASEHVQITVIGKARLLQQSRGAKQSEKLMNFPFCPFDVRVAGLFWRNCSV